MSLIISETAALNRLIQQTHKLSEEYVKLFNTSPDPNFQTLLNELTPNIIAAKMMLQDRLRLLQQQQPVQ